MQITPTPIQPFANIQPNQPVDTQPEQVTNRPVLETSRDAAVNNQDSPSKNRTDKQLTQDEARESKELQARDREVRAHEAAHKNAAGSLAKGGAQFSYETGPDGRRYAVGGEVNIDTSKVDGDPEATIRKAQQIRRAANAPADPSGQDRSVAAQAANMEAEARQELNEKRNNQDADSPASLLAGKIETGNQEKTSPGTFIDLEA